MIASRIWRLENAARFHCPICSYKTHNKTIFRRHLDSTRHFLLSEFAHQAPRDIKMLVATFLPFERIYLLGQIAVDALNYNTTDCTDCTDWMPWRFKLVDLGDPLFRTGVVRVHLTHKRQIPVFSRLPG